MRRVVVWAMVIGFGSAATGCVTAPPRPSVYAYPAKGQSAEQMSRDQTECQVWAKQQTGFDPARDTAKGAGLGAVIGALGGAAAGAAIGAAAGDAGKGAAVGAAAGGIGGAGVGGAVGYSKNKQGYDKAYAACMSARGYVTNSAIQAPAQKRTIPPPAAPPTVPRVGVPSTPPVIATPPPAVVRAPRRLHVPPGHYPPPGYCRLWYPGRPPGHQPRAFPCQRLVVSRGAFILYNGAAWDTDYDWHAHARRHPGSVPRVIMDLTGRR